MRLLFSLTYYTPYVSGLTLYVKRLGEALIKKSYEVTVLTMNFDKHCRLAEIVNGVKVVRADYLVKISKGFISIDWLIKSWQEVKKADVVFINLPQFEGIWPALFGKIFGKKVISIYHCEVNLPEGIINHLIERLLNISHFITLLLSDLIITYTKDFADHSKMLPHFREKLNFVYPPILVPKIDKRVQKLLIDKIYVQSHPGKRSASRIPNRFWTPARKCYASSVAGGSQNDKPFIIGVAARLAAEKGIEYLFEAIPLLKDKFQISNFKFQIIIAGSLDPVGEQRYRDKILKLVEKYKDYVVFLGELKEENMGSFYSLLDILVLPSINSTEAFGMVQVEAMIAGVPVVATDLPGVRVPIQMTGMGKIVPVRDSRKLADAIVDVLSNKKEYIKDKEKVQKEFSFEKTINFYEKLIHE